MGIQPLSICLCGDILLSQRIPAVPYAGFDELCMLMRSHECRCGNLESTYHNKEGYPSAFPGGHYCMARPECLDDLRRMGFNLVATANNHAMDYSHGGLLATLRHLDEYGIAHAGTGANLAEASKAAFYECSSGRVGLLGITSSFHDSYAAGPQNSELQGRPGVAPLRHKAIYNLEPRMFAAIQEIADACMINAVHKWNVENGFAAENPHMRFGTYEFQRAGENSVHTTPDEGDVLRTTRIIEDARHLCDLTVVSLHSHKFAGQNPEQPTEFAQIFCRQCIDAGADIVFCTGPLVLRGIERYGRGIIFHGLGNFIFQNDEMDYLPEEFYLRRKTTRAQETGVGGIGNIMTHGWTRGLPVTREAWESVLVSAMCTPEEIQVTLHPVSMLSKGYPKGLKGLPILSRDTAVLHRLQKLSDPWGTDLLIDESDKTARLNVSRI